MIARDAACAVAGAFLLNLSAQAGTLTTLYAFQGAVDGAEPVGALAYVGGMFYGTTELGGQSNDGTIFKFDPTTGQKITLYSFTGGSDGANPLFGLTLLGGALYGTAINGGIGDNGVVFKFSIKTGSESTVCSFKGGTDGSGPYAPVLAMGGLLYGSTVFGGTEGGYGTVYQLDPGTGAETVLTSFNFGTPFYTCNPEQGLVALGGILYGPGICNAGSLFGVNPATSTSYPLYQFTSAPNDASGENPYAGLTPVGNLLYGNTENGGYYPKPACAGSGCGTIFSIDPSTGALTTLYTFQESGTTSPQNTLLYRNGALYGTSSAGKKSGGDLFEFRINSGQFKTLFSFTSGTASTTGYYPNQLIYTSGAFYGTTHGGGCLGGTCSGTLFKFVP